MPKINLTDLSNLQNEVTATSAINTNNSIIEDAIDNTISRDGTQPNNMNANLDMNSNKIINLPDATTDQEPVTYGQFIEGVTSLENGAVIDADFVTLSSHPSITNERILTAGPSIELVDGGAGGNLVVGVSSDELNALAGTGSDEDKLPYYDGIGSAAITDFTPFARTLVDDVDAETARTTLGFTPLRTIQGTVNEVDVTNGDGVAGDPTISLPDALTFTGKTVTGGTFTSPSITTPTGIVKGDVGLGNVDNTSDVNKPVSTATQTALDDKVTGPASAISGNITTFNGTTGKIVQDSGKVLPTGTIVGTTDTQTLTNKTIVGSANSISAVPVTSLSITGTPNGLKFLRDDATWTAIPGGGDLLSTNNLSDVASVSTSRTNLSALGGGLKSQVFTASGTFTTPATSRTDTVYRYRMVGGGGGGGYGSTATSSPGGGGSGAYAEGTFTGVAPSTGITITVGAAGAAGTSVSSSTAGGSTSIGSPVSITTSGGGGAPNVTTTSVGDGGNPGTVTGSPNVMSFSGSRGKTGIAGTSSSLGGGGDGADSMMGQAGKGGVATKSASHTVTVTGYGSGGGASFATGNAGVGAPGIVIIEWFES